MLNNQANVTTSTQNDALQAMLRCRKAIAALIDTREACKSKKEQLGNALDCLQAAIDRLSAGGLRTAAIENILGVAEGLLQSEIVPDAAIVEVERDFDAAKQLFNQARLHIQGRPKTDAMYEEVVRISNRRERSANEAQAKLDTLLARITGAQDIVQHTLETLQDLVQRVAGEVSRPGPELSP